MMGRRKSEHGQLFYAFNLEAVVPDDHQVRRIAAVLDLAWVRTELAPHYSHTGRPSIDPELMIRMLILGYVFAIRSERALCREVQHGDRYVCSRSMVAFASFRATHCRRRLWTTSRLRQKKVCLL